jgi:ribonuclease HI
LRSADLSSILRRLAETLSFARLLEEQPQLRPGDLRKLMEEAAARVEETDDLEEAAPANKTTREKRSERERDRLAKAAGIELAAAGEADDEVSIRPRSKAAPRTQVKEVEESTEDSPQLADESDSLERDPVIPDSVGTIQVDVFVDGASKGNPGPSAVGYVIAEPGGIEFVAQGRFIGRATNNEAEYRALLRALEAAEKWGFRKLKIHSDSQLLIRQLEGRYRVNSPQLKALYDKARERLATFDTVKLIHIPRELNSRADALANEAVKAEKRRQKASEKRRPTQSELSL